MMIHHVSADRVYHSAHSEKLHCSPLCGVPPEPTEPEVEPGRCAWCKDFDQAMGLTRAEAFRIADAR